MEEGPSTDGNGVRPDYSCPETLGTRNRAYRHLKEAMDEICKFGQFVFKGNKERVNRYRSEYLRGRNLKLWRERQKKKAAATKNPLPVSSTSNSE